MSDSEPMSSDEWCTPWPIVGPLAQFFGGPVGVDPCSNERSIVRADAHYSWGGLVRSWRSKKKTAFMNNPYSTNDPWADKAVYEMKVGHVDELVTLMMVAPSTTWWRTLCVSSRRNPRLIFTPRLKFIGKPNGPKEGARFDTVLKYFGRRHRAFEREFKHVTRWLAWGR